MACPLKRKSQESNIWMRYEPKGAAFVLQHLTHHFNESLWGIRKTNSSHMVRWHFLWKLSRYTKTFFFFFNHESFIYNCISYIVLTVNSSIKCTFNKQAFFPPHFSGVVFWQFQQFAVHMNSSWTGKSLCGLLEAAVAPKLNYMHISQPQRGAITN